MFRHAVVAAALLVAVGARPAHAQAKVEAGVNFGWTFSDGVSGNAVTVPGVGVFDRVDPKDSGSLGFHVGVLVTENAEVGFLYSHQFSNLVLGGTSDKELGSMGINSYHGYFQYNFAPHDHPLVPFIYGGLGATSFSSVDATVNGAARNVGGGTQFSTTWGGGVKFFPNPKAGVRIAASWTPTYIKSDPGGWWCDPYWGCYLVGNAQYANQFTISGGVLFRF